MIFILCRDLVGMGTMWITLTVLLATSHVAELQGKSVFVLIRGMSNHFFIPRLRLCEKSQKRQNLPLKRIRLKKNIETIAKSNPESNHQPMIYKL